MGTAALGLSATTGSSQVIVYTDVNPDEVINPGSFYELDMDNDLTGEFFIWIASLSGTYGSTFFSGYQAAVMPWSSGNSVLVYDYYGYPRPVAMNSGSWISAGQSMSSNSGGGWLLAQSLVMSGTYTFGGGAFQGVSDAYIGVRFDMGGQPHYGWVRIDVAPGADKITVKDYAYHSVATREIMAGQVGVGIDEENELEITLQQTEDMIQIKWQSGEARVELYDLTGHMLAHQTTLGSAAINTEGLATGVYLVQITNGESRNTQKIYIR